MRMCRYSDYTEAWRTIANMRGRGWGEGGEGGERRINKVDLSLFPSLVYMEYYMPRVRGVEMDDFLGVWGGGLGGYYRELRRGWREFEDYRRGLFEALDGSEKVKEGIRRIKEDVEGKGGWRIPERKVGGFKECFG
ncbi:hypothetical protein TrRE_jg6537 [Triparma retinervis]|uniref:Uncharacterized protein n=1 Tax=Triparma retinervis TaxID=2557542 RepID=A0A9W7DPU8_9STRA|nr:hypothetical protein TrRE_jg6537 [Triparma retinervis]